MPPFVRVPFSKYVILPLLPFNLYLISLLIGAPTFSIKNSFMESIVLFPVRFCHSFFISCVKSL